MDLFEFHYCENLGREVERHCKWRLRFLVVIVHCLFSHNALITVTHGGSPTCLNTLRKLAHGINREFSSFKIENFQLKKFDIFLIFAQNTDCGYKLEPPRRGGSNEYPQSMFWSKNKKNRYTPAYPSFTI